MRGNGTAAQAAANLDPAHPLDHPVEDDEVRRSFLGQEQCLIAIGGANDVIAFAIEVPGQQVRKCPVVFDQQECGLSHGSACYDCSVTLL